MAGGHRPDDGPARSKARRAIQVRQHDGDVRAVTVGFLQEGSEIGAAATVETQVAQVGTARFEAHHAPHAVVADDQ